MDEKADRQKNPELDIDPNTGEIIPDNAKKTYETPEATKAGSPKRVSRTASGDQLGGDSPTF